MDASFDDDNNKNNNIKQYLCNGDVGHKILKMWQNQEKSNCSLHLQQNV